jgi:molybdopterin-containing oxidoreductase family molybdopterin binding subunit
VIVDIKGEPDSPLSRGSLCAKGKAGIMGVYDPYRLTRPLKRTNPEKGIGIDPMWVEIDREEALEIITKKLKEVKEEDPRGLLVWGLDFQLSAVPAIFCSAFGTPNRGQATAAYYCGPALHLVHYLMEGAFQGEPDFKHCNYLLMVGSQEGMMVSLVATFMAREMAEARARGMKLVVVDPVCGVAASKADEWVPIRPGTDGAFALGLMNVLINELGIYDAEFIKRYTNGPYLVGEDGSYIRDPESGKPLVWDAVQGRAKSYDSSVADYALEGPLTAAGRSCHPAFWLLKEHVKGYSPEVVAEITSVPAETLRRLGREFGQAARVGSEIAIDGVKYPCRPAACIWRRGAGAHKHGGMAALALNMLNMIIGASDVPGGLLGQRTVTHLGGPKTGPDGLIIPNDFALTGHRPYPARRPEAPQTLSLTELFPIACDAEPMVEEGVIDPKGYGLDYACKVLIHLHTNVMMTASNPPRMAQMLKRVPFMVSFSTYATETVEFADIVLPDAHYLERLIPFPNSKVNGYPSAADSWYFTFQQPVLEPPEGVRPWPEVVLELAHRLELSADFNRHANIILRLKGPFRLEPDKRYSWSEIVDRWAQSWFGAEYSLDRLKGQGYYKAEKKVEDRYPRIFIKSRVPIYFEHIKKAGEELYEVTKRLDLSWDTADYRALPDWLPCQAHEMEGKEFDLYAVAYKLPFVSSTTPAQNPLLKELAQHHLSATAILINSAVGFKKGIKDGDTIWLESTAGKIKGEARLTEMVHPEVVGMAWHFGQWAKVVPGGQGIGVHFNALLSSGPDGIDKLSGGQDCCAKVKVYKA